MDNNTANTIPSSAGDPTTGQPPLAGGIQPIASTATTQPNTSKTATPPGTTPTGAQDPVETPQVVQPAPPPPPPQQPQTQSPITIAPLTQTAQTVFEQVAGNGELRFFNPLVFPSTTNYGRWLAVPYLTQTYNRLLQVAHAPILVRGK